MESRVVNIGEKPIEFVLGIEKDTGTPSWIATIDEVWLSIVGNDLYNSIMGHQFLCINKNIDDKKDFAATMNISSFKSLLFTGEALRFQELVMALMDISLNRYLLISPVMYISFISETSQHAVNASLEIEKGIILFGAQLGNKLTNLK